MKGLIAVVLAGAAGLSPAAGTPRAANSGASGLVSRGNVWVDRTGGSCSRRASHVRYVDGRACSSLSAAYAIARAGDTIVVARGTYGRQVIPAGAKKLTIRNAFGVRPIFGTTTVEASHVTLIGVTIRRDDDPGPYTATLEAKGSHDTFDRILVDSRNAEARQGIYAHGDWNVFRNGGTFHVVDEKGALVGGSHVTFVNFDFHDVGLTGPGVHNECVYSDGPNLTVRRSRFWNCATMDLYVTRGDWWNQPAYGGVTIVNNVFGHSRMPERGSWHYYGLVFGGTLAYDGAPLRNFKVRYNTFETSVALSGFKAVGDSEWVGNVGGGWDCIPGMQFRYNVGEKCSASDKAVSPATSCGPPSCQAPRPAAQGWVNPGKQNFRLKRGAPAINAGDPRDFPSVDKDGHRRPKGRRPDAGAYEFGARH